MMSDKWIMEDWMREVLEAIGYNGEGISEIERAMSSPRFAPESGDPSRTVLMHELKSLRTAGLLPTPGEKQGWDALNSQAANKLDELWQNISRLRAEKQDGDEALQRESLAVADANREIERLWAENESLRNALRDISTCNLDEPCAECNRVALTALGDNHE